MTELKLNALYVSALDFDRAREFYTDILFRREPTRTTDRFVFYDLGGVLFGVFDPAVTGEEVTYGTNCVPTIEVDDLDALHDRLASEGVEIVMPVQTVNDTRIFQCRDPAGNVLEFYQWIT